MSAPHNDLRTEERPLLLFVCSGNICRSPMAAALAADAAVRKGLRINVESAGTLALVGDPAEDGARRALVEIGLSLAGHRARQADSAIVEAAARAVGLTNIHAAWLLRQSPLARVMSFHQLTGLGDIPDPYGGGMDEYRQVRELLRAGLPAVLDALKASLATKAKPRKSV